MLHTVSYKVERRPVVFKPGRVSDRILKILSENPGSTSSELAALYYKEHNSATSLSTDLREMVEAGLLTTKSGKGRLNRKATLYWRAQ